ncbi:hypothetical protein GALL_246890 [mine drainage metagenome]|uniref:Uncharacterized protein n=1 Tax=mine drainage metagenome TaxID=410659 RepID=A0A1J5RN36_9ZZZZ
MFAALAVSRTVQERTGHSICTVLRDLRPLRSAAFEINGATRTDPPAINDHHRALLDALAGRPARH